MVIFISPAVAHRKKGTRDRCTAVSLRVPVYGHSQCAHNEVRTPGTIYPLLPVYASFFFLVQPRRKFDMEIERNNKAVAVGTHETGVRGVPCEKFHFRCDRYLIGYAPVFYLRTRGQLNAIF